MRWLVPFLLVALVAGHPQAQAALIIDQVGNLLENGNFETGARDPWKENDFPLTLVTGDKVVDGDFAAFIDATTGQPGSSGDFAIGLYQYPLLPNGIYATSAWFYPLVGQVHIGIAEGAGIASHFSSPTTELNRWQYLELTHSKDGVGGTLLYALGLCH